jgi:hypothetical protein
VKSVVCVDPDGTSLEGVGDLNGGVEVGCVDGGSKTVCGVVTDADGISLVLEFGDRANGSEDLLLHDGHVVLDVGEDGGLDEVSLVTLTLAAGNDGGTLVLAGLDVSVWMLVCCSWKGSIDGNTYPMILSNWSCET